MKLNKKKELAARALQVGKGRIVFNIKRLDEIKEAITKQDIIDLHSRGAIIIKPIKGRKKVEKRKNRRKMGRRKKYILPRKKAYMILTRKLRSYLSALEKEGEITKENLLKLRKEIRASEFKSLVQIKDRLKALK